MKTKTKKSKKQFILDTLLPYKEDPSTCAITESGACLYLTSDGRKCAVGKYMVEGPHQNYYMTIDNLFKASDFTFKDVFTEEALEQNLSIKEWTRIQMYHDVIAKLASWGESPHKKYITARKVNAAVDDLEKVTGLELPELRMDL